MWECSGSGTLLALHKLRNRAARTLKNSVFDVPSSPSIKNLKWMTMAYLISFELNQLVSKSVNDQAPQYICNLFQGNSDCSSRDLRNTAKDLRLPLYTSSNDQKSFSYRRATLWNNLAIGVKTGTLPISF